MMSRASETIPHYTLFETIIIVLIPLIIALLVLMGMQAWVKQLKRKKVNSRYWQIRAFYLLGILASAFIIFSFARGIYSMLTSTGLPSPMETLASEQFQFSIDYPKNWAASDLPGGNHGDHEAIAFIGFTGPAQPYILISRKTFDQPTLDDVAAWGESRIAVIVSNGSVVSMGSLSSPNDTTLIRHYSRTSQGLFGSSNDKCMDWYTIVNSTGYDLQFCVREKYWPEMEATFLQIAQSFEAR
jgi:hypothetical protein